VNATDEVGDTALHAATFKGRLDVVKYLLSKGADPNVANKTGSTPLHKLVLSRYDQMPILKTLLKYDADPSIRNGAGHLPEQLAKPKVRELLLGDQAVTDSVEVHKMLHGKIIGKAGSKIREIREATGTTITIPEQNDNSNKIIINGRREGVDKAKEMIHEAVSQGKETAAEDDGKAHVKLNIPKEKHRIIIGKGGGVVNEIREENGVEISIPPPGDPDTSIIVRGDTMDDVDNAVKKIYSLIRDQAASAGAAGGAGFGRGRGLRRDGANGRGEDRSDKKESKKVDVPKNKHKHIIGKEGRTINEIRSEFGVEIDIPPPGYPDTQVTVSGDTIEGVEAAAARIQEIVERSESNGVSGGGGERGGDRGFRRDDGYQGGGGGGGGGGRGRGFRGDDGERRGGDNNNNNYRGNGGGSFGRGAGGRPNNENQGKGAEGRGRGRGRGESTSSKE